MLYDLILSNFNGDEIMIIDLCMTLCNMDATQAYNTVDNMPCVLAIGVDMKEAKKIKKAFEYEGAFIDISASKSDNTYNEFADNNILSNQPNVESNFIKDCGNEKEGVGQNNEHFEEKTNNQPEFEEGINLEKIFEENININMTPNDYGDYALDKLEQRNESDKEEIEGRKIKEIFNEFVEETVDFSNCTYNSNDKPAYNIQNKPSKQYISKEDIVKIERERINNINKKNNQEEKFNIAQQNKKVKNNKQYITKDFINTGHKQEIILEEDNSFMDFGNNPYDEDCMQINTQKRDINMDSSEKGMKNLYNKKAVNAMNQSEEGKVDDQWIKALKKSSNKDKAHNTNAFQKEQMMCPKCGSAFVSCKKSQGFFGTGKIKYICEACKHKF